MKRFFRSLAVILLILISACALPYPTSAPAPSPQPTSAPADPLPADPLPTQPASAPTQKAATPPAATQPAPAKPAPTRPSGQVNIPLVVSGSNGAAPSNGPYPAPETPTPAPTATATQASGEIVRIPPYDPHTGEQHSYVNFWKWPVVPVVSQRAKEIYQKGLAQGNDPKHFSKVGDCQVIRQYFLGYFDQPDQSWRLDTNWPTYKPVLENFNGSYFRLSAAVRTGFNVASVLSSINADPAQSCKAGETPLECEVRIWKPSIAIVSMETWTKGRPTQAYEGYLRQIVDYLLSKNVLPILATKADNLEGDNSINTMIARVAFEYDIPLWNFYAAAQPLPSHGLESDGFHLTNGESKLHDEGLKIGWNVRNLTALQALDKVWREVSGKK